MKQLAIHAKYADNDLVGYNFNIGKYYLKMQLSYLSLK